MPKPSRKSAKRSNKGADFARVVTAVAEGATHRGTVQETDGPRKLLLDYDSYPPKCTVLFQGLRRLGLIPSAVYYAPSNTRGHWHIVVYLRVPVALPFRLFAQIYLGSDRERERNNFVRAYHFQRTDKYVQVLFGEKL